MAIAIDHGKYQGFSFQSPGNGFCRIEVAMLVLLAELTADFIRPGGRGFCRIWRFFGRLDQARDRFDAFGLLSWWRRNPLWLGGWRRSLQRYLHWRRCWRFGGRAGQQFFQKGQGVEKQRQCQGQGKPVIGPDHEKMQFGLSDESIDETSNGTLSQNGSGCNDNRDGLRNAGGRNGGRQSADAADVCPQHGTG